jgi:hypothetical protein
VCCYIRPYLQSPSRAAAAHAQRVGGSSQPIGRVLRPEAVPMLAPGLAAPAAAAAAAPAAAAAVAVAAPVASVRVRGPRIHLECS